MHKEHEIDTDKQNKNMHVRKEWKACTIMLLGRIEVSSILPRVITGQTFRADQY